MTTTRSASTHPAQPSCLEDLLARARRLAASATPSRRRLLGIAGPPGAGKSTLAARLVAELAGSCALVPMDGFHLAEAELRRLGRTERKGAPDTFDAAGYAALLARLRAPEPDTLVYAPAFDRRIEEPVAGSIPVPPDLPLVVTEGNYLLLEDGPWARVRPLLDEVWYVELDGAERVRRLIDRHERFGKPRERAERFVYDSDEANARTVEAGRRRADLVVGFAPGEAPAPLEEPAPLKVAAPLEEQAPAERAAKGEGP
ncbi:nucleoside/nucleotide kinase family protein [Streptomyces sp. MST-110588]|uniref:nucleoside/nucleotide kinase family protein n=1 Tax=Streptomyces sp. MST-110588 TaxID=2833628 RepID=UPI001F5D2EB1|nr:nucleoside/nucleotide kinase family protein [Streptomyces sp. MST-110588]UNO42296.1 nucleoside/nucleotide kinase family protein [Streptomyces sp. MST-110588]